jgi:hypothetical protein
MPDLLLILVPLIVGSAVVPVQLVATVLLLRSPAGRSGALAWVAGMTLVRLLQGALFGVVLGAADGAGATSETTALESGVLLVLAILFYVMAAKKALKAPDEDAPPPRWMSMLDGLTPARAFLLGAGALALAAKSWVFTLGAIGAIQAAGLGAAGGIASYVAFVVLAQGIHLALLAVAYAAPERSEVVVGRFADLLERYDRPLMIGLGIVFGTWFLLGGLSGLGVP